MLVFKTTFSLAPYGEEYKESFAIFKLFNRKQAWDYLTETELKSKLIDEKEISDEEAMKRASSLIEYAYETIKKQFISGKIFDGKELVDMEAKNIDEFPTAMLKDIAQV